MGVESVPQVVHPPLEQRGPRHEKRAGGLCSGFRVRSSGFMVHGSGFKVQGSGFRVQGSGFRI